MHLREVKERQRDEGGVELECHNSPVEQKKQERFNEKLPIPFKMLAAHVHIHFSFKLLSMTVLFIIIISRCGRASGRMSLILVSGLSLE